MNLENTGPQTPLELIRTTIMEAREGDGPYLPQQRAKILRNINDLIGARNLTRREVMGILGCSRPLLSQLLSGKYAGDADKYLARAVQWMRDQQRSDEAAPETPFVKTDVAKRILTACELACDEPCMAVVMAPAGAGKTAALREFARRRSGRTEYIQAGESCSTKTGLALELADRLEIKVLTRSTTPRLLRDIRDKLARYYAGGRGTRWCFLIDEATTLGWSAINLLRNLHDDPAARCAVVLADTWRFDAALHSRRGIAGGNEQIRSRAQAVFRMSLKDQIPLADVRAVADSILASLGHARPLDQAAYHYLHKLAQADGKLRNVAGRIHAAAMFARRMQLRCDFTVAQLDYVASLVGAECELKHAEIPFGRAADGHAAGVRESRQSRAAG